MIFQYGWEPVLIQWILIGFEAVLETKLYFQWGLFPGIVKSMVIDQLQLNPQENEEIWETWVSCQDFNDQTLSKFLFVNKK